MAGAKTSVRAEQEQLRARMRAFGLDYGEVAAEFARRYRLRPRAAFRHAYGWTLTQAAGQVNTCAAETGLVAFGVRACARRTPPARARLLRQRCATCGSAPPG